MDSDVSDIELQRPMNMARIHADECWLSAEGKAGEYFQDLNRQALDSADTDEQIHRTVQRLKDALTGTVPSEKRKNKRIVTTEDKIIQQKAETKVKAKFGQVSFVSVYRLAQQEGVESTLFWLLENSRVCQNTFPKKCRSSMPSAK